MTFADRLVLDWYAPRLTPLTAVLAPIAPLFRAVAAVRRSLYRAGVLKSDRLPVPVVVIGNITVGGSGKTPLAIALAAALATRGWHPGIVSRGYGAKNSGPRAVGAEAFREGRVHALAGIGNPQRFFDHLKGLGIVATCHPFPDHHRFTRQDLELPRATAILMTEKDAVKCTAFADDRCWALPIRAVVDPKLFALVEEKLRGPQVARDSGVPGHQGAADI